MHFVIIDYFFGPVVVKSTSRHSLSTVLARRDWDYHAGTTQGQVCAAACVHLKASSEATVRLLIKAGSPQTQQPTY